MKRILTSLLLAICFCSISFAQDDDATEKTKKALAAAAKNGNPLRTQLTVNGTVNVQAVLIPRVDAQRIFGKEIAENYAVVEVNVGNKSGSAALIIHGIFIDYRDWPLSGAAPSELSSLRNPDPFQASALPNQVASEEYRVVRGQLLDAQADTLRNRVLRYLTLAGNLAGAFTFSINEQGIIRGIAAATGVGIPGLATAWPDKTIDQLNRVSDFGFRANKVIPKEGSDVIVCFFPIDRFLTPGFRKLFLKSPALFFAPMQMLVDKSVEKDVRQIMAEVLAGNDLQFEDLKGAMPCFMTVAHRIPGNPGYPICLDDFGLEQVPDKPEGVLRVKQVKVDDKTWKRDPDAEKKFRKYLILQFLGSVSLNRVVITVDGVMTVDVTTLAANIDAIEMTKLAECGDADGQCFWRNVAIGSGVRQGVIRGSFLGGGKVEIAGADLLGISDIKVIAEGSNESELRFSFKLNKPVDTQTKLNFTVVKEETGTDAAKTKKFASNAWVFLVDYAIPPVSISDATVSGSTLTVKGKGFKPVAGASPMTVSLHSQDGTEVKVPGANVTMAAGDTGNFTVNLTGLNLKAVCWHAQVNADKLTSNQSDWFLPTQPAPTLTSASHNGKFIFLKGTDLVNLIKCGGPKISFRLKPASGAAIALTVDSWSNGSPVLVLPEAGKTGTWKVEVLKDGTPANEVDLKANP